MDALAGATTAPTARSSRDGPLRFHGPMMSLSPSTSPVHAKEGLRLTRPNNKITSSSKHLTTVQQRMGASTRRQCIITRPKTLPVQGQASASTKAVLFAIHHTRDGTSACFRTLREADRARFALLFAYRRFRYPYLFFADTPPLLDRTRTR